MKKALFLLCTLSVSFFFISSCGKKSDNGVYIAPGTNGNGNNNGNSNGNGNGNGSGGGIVTANVNGTPYSSSSVIYSSLGEYSFTSYLTSPVGTLAILLDSLNVGTYKLQASAPAIGYSVGTTATYYSYSIMPFKIGAGSIVITSNNGSTISGTFSATVYNYTNASDSLKITNGVFTNLTY